MDPDREDIARWLEEECDAERGNTHKWETSAALFERWSAYAERNGIAYRLMEPKPRQAVRKSYADNFRFGRTGAWTH